MASLQDQLLKAGLVDQKQARQLKQATRKQSRRARSGGSVEDPAQVALERQQRLQAEREEKLQKDRERAARQRAEEDKRASLAAARQMILQHRLSREGGDQAYQFVDSGRIKKLYLLRKQVDELARGKTGIVRDGDRYELVPADVALRIAERVSDMLVVLHTAAASTAAASIATEGGAGKDLDGDDYSDFPIPDDLMW